MRDVNIIEVLREFTELLPQHTTKNTCEQNTDMEIRIKVRDGKISSYFFEWNPAKEELNGKKESNG